MLLATSEIKNNDNQGKRIETTGKIRALVHSIQ